jgi:hypothetical protein
MIASPPKAAWMASVLAISIVNARQEPVNFPNCIENSVASDHGDLPKPELPGLATHALRDLLTPTSKQDLLYSAASAFNTLAANEFALNGGVNEGISAGHDPACSVSVAPSAPHDANASRGGIHK